MKNGYKVIDIEHHFATQDMCDQCAKMGIEPSVTLNDTDGCYKYIYDLGEERIKEMDSAGVDFAHISLTSDPGAEFLPVETSKHVAAVANDVLAEAVARHPNRFGGWIELAPEDPLWCIKEIDRAVAMGLYGWATISNFKGERLDSPKYWPILEKIEDTGMPIYLHPTFSVDPSLTEFGFCTKGPSIGFMLDVSITFMRMILRGVFDRFPKLKIILGHDGEAFPFLKNRMDTAHRQKHGRPNPAVAKGSIHEPSYYLEQNVWITTSGNYLYEALRCCIDVMAPDRVLFSSDYPYEELAHGVNFIADNDKVTDAEKRVLLWDNAAALGFGPKK
ncbi:MAG: amidohydrolase family protein [Synergistes sp.]|nr:amidohydrolase family protein [Synergistes sp.]